MTRDRSPPQQTSLFAAFEEAETEARTAHLPSTLEDAVPLVREIIARYNAAMLAGDQPAKTAARQERDDIGWKLTDLGLGDCFADVGRQLNELCAAPQGEVPLWGQSGDFIIEALGCRIRIEWEGLYSITEIQFGAHAVDLDKPFISETGYRSVMTYEIDCTGGAPPVDALVHDLIEHHIASALKGRLVAIKPEYSEHDTGPQVPRHEPHSDNYAADVS